MIRRNVSLSSTGILIQFTNTINNNNSNIHPTKHIFQLQNILVSCIWNLTSSHYSSSDGNTGSTGTNNYDSRRRQYSLMKTGQTLDYRKFRCSKDYYRYVNINYNSIMPKRQFTVHTYGNNQNTTDSTNNNKTNNESDSLRCKNQPMDANINNSDQMNSNNRTTIPTKDSISPTTRTDTIEYNDQVQQQLKKNKSSIVIQHWIQQLQSIPNMITVSRIVLIPFVSYWIITHQTMLACVGCIYAAISDVLDGYIARRYPSMQTPLGTYLDPLGT
jgi:CDP-alcohol phosphatidyltransferase